MLHKDDIEVKTDRIYKKICDKCGIPRRHLTLFGNEFVCGKCRRNGRTMSRTCEKRNEKKRLKLKDNVKGGIENGI